MIISSSLTHQLTSKWMFVTPGNGNVILAKKLMESNLFTVEDIKKLTQPSNVLPILMQAVLSNSPEVRFIHQSV
jgi:hypothetical protein